MLHWPNESNKQLFANIIKGQQEIEREEREKDRLFFLKLGKAMFSNTVTVETKYKFHILMYFVQNQSLKSGLKMRCSVYCS